MGGYAWEFANPAIDGLGHIFVSYDPGRLRGVIVLRPTDEGMEDFGTLVTEESCLYPYGGRFYGAEVADTNGDGILEIEHQFETGDESCPEGVLAAGIFEWNGHDYELQAP